MKKKKSQIWFMDLIIGITLFTLILVVAFKFLSSKYIEPDKEKNLVLLDGQKMSDSLMSTGIPQNWSEEHVVVIGITSNENVLNLTKLDMLKNMSLSDYSRLKYLLGVRSDFILYFLDIEDNIINITNTTYIGKEGIEANDLIDKKVEDMVTIDRYLVYKHNETAEIVEMKVILWQE
jgi:hypothetical protein